MGIINTGTVGTALQIISNVIIPLKSDNSIGDVSNTGNLDFRPANWIFSIWAVIYTSVLAGFGLDKGKSLKGMNEKIAYVIASLSNPFAMITSKNNLLNSDANFLFILKLQQTIPPKALIGSQERADL